MAGATSLRELAAGATGGTRSQRLYREDAWTWAKEQAGALRRRDVAAIDWENVIEEIEDVGKRHSDRWISNCREAIAHLLRIEHYGSVENLNHWRREVGGYRRRMYRTLRDHRGMKGELDEMLATAWEDGRTEAVEKMAEYDAPDDPAAQDRQVQGWNLRMPTSCPYALEDIAGYDPFDNKAQPRGDVWPAAVARVLNDALETDYPVRFRAPEREAGRRR